MQEANTQVIPINRDAWEEGDLVAAAEALRGGKIVVFPTETVYGVGCRYDDDSAKQRIFALKQRDAGKPLGVYLAETEEISRYAVVSQAAEKLIEAFLPGPLTLVLLGLRGGTLGFRVPSDEIAKRLISLGGTGLAGTSANLSGQPSAVEGREAIAALSGKVDVIIDAGKTELGRASTVIDLSDDYPVLLREGVISAKDLAKVLLCDIGKAF
jgi:L-threonylcarbamoyladenylate synthase